MSTSAESAGLPAKPTSPFSVFRRRNFSLMWSGQFVETIGCALTSLAASILVYRITDGSALAVGLMLMASAAPSLLFGLLAGVIVDRYDRKRIMIIADVLRAVLVCLVPFLVPYGIVWLYVAVLVISTIGQFFDPAWESVLPEAAPDEELAAANSLMAISVFGSTAIGFAASGLIASRLSIDLAFYINGLAYLFSAACILFIKVQKIEAEDSTSIPVIFKNLKEGIATLVRVPVLKSLILLTIPVAFLTGLVNALLLPFATRALNATEFEYGLQEGLTSVGFVVASLLMASYMERWREGQWMVVSLIGLGVLTAVYSLLSSVPLAILLMILSGFFNAPYVIARRLLTQRNTEAEVRGRVISGYYVSFNIFFLIGMAAAGLADVMNIRLLFFVGGGVLSIACGIWGLFLPGIGQPAAEWRRALALLRSAPPSHGMGVGRAVEQAYLNRLFDLLPELSGLGKAVSDRILTLGAILDVEPSTRIMSAGEASDSAYFILSGKAVAGVAGGTDSYHSLSSMEAGDYFGEIAALTGAARTADVVAQEATQLLQVPASVLRQMMAQPAFSQILLRRMSERLARTSIRDLPRFSAPDPQAARQLREETGAARRTETALA
jgi:MFS transporter, DHA3 family, macrolide efflux protein